MFLQNPGTNGWVQRIFIAIKIINIFFIIHRIFQTL